MDPDEVEGLIPRHITLKRELDEYEQANILAAQEWTESRLHRNILSEAYVRRLHKKMLGKTWRWAGLTFSSLMVPAPITPSACNE